jgi:hypothetical protein
MPNDPDDDDTVDLTIRPAFRTPDEWNALYARFPRLLAALASIDVAFDTLYLIEPADDAAPEVLSAFEQEADELADQERRARDHIIAWFAGFTDKDSAVVLPDGRIIAISLEADGLAVVSPENVHRPS